VFLFSSVASFGNRKKEDKVPKLLTIDDDYYEQLKSSCGAMRFFSVRVPMCLVNLDVTLFVKLHGGQKIMMKSQSYKIVSYRGISLLHATTNEVSS
jgi:hypothetical protein